MKFLKLTQVIVLGIVLLLGITTLGGCNKTSVSSVSDSGSLTQTTSDILYLDVREDDERAAGHVSGAIHLPLGQVEAGSTSSLPKDQTLAVYCRSGRRSALAVQALKSQGFTNIIDVGGMDSIQGVEIVR